MKCTFSSSSLLLLLAAAVFSIVDAINVQITTDKCGVDPFANLEYTTTCNNDECNFGDMAYIDGTIEATTNFTTNDGLIVESCLMEFYCPEENTYSESSLCYNWLVPTDENQTCGEAGFYKISHFLEIPEADVPNYFTRWVSIKVGMDESSCTEEEVQMAYSSTSSSSSSGSPGGGSATSSNSRSSGGRGGSSSSYHMSYSMMGAIFGVAFGGALAGKRRCEEDDDMDYGDYNEEEEPSVFMEMQQVVCGPMVV